MCFILKAMIHSTQNADLIQGEEYKYSSETIIYQPAFKVHSTIYTYIQYLYRFEPLNTHG